MKIEKVHIGQLVAQKVAERGFSKASFGRLFGISRGNINAMVFHKPSLDTDFLSRICEALDYNFFRHFVPALADGGSAAAFSGAVSAKISERLAMLIEFLGETPNSFGKKLGYDRTQTVYDVLSGKSAPGFDFMNRFASSEFSEKINTDWLLTGRGEFLRSSSSSGHNVVASEGGVAAVNSEVHVEPSAEVLQLRVLMLEKLLAEKERFISLLLESRPVRPSVDDSSGEILK